MEQYRTSVAWGRLSDEAGFTVNGFARQVLVVNRRSFLYFNLRSQMRIEPLGSKVVVKRTEADEVTAGGIVLPDSAREKPSQGRVLSVGNGPLLGDGARGTMQVSEGDRVLFSSYSGTEIDVDGDTLLIMNEADILAVMP